MIKQENTKSLTCFESRSWILGSTANEFIIIAFCYERAGLVVSALGEVFVLFFVFVTTRQQAGGFKDS